MGDIWDGGRRGGRRGGRKELLTRLGAEEGSFDMVGLVRKGYIRYYILETVW